MSAILLPLPLALAQVAAPPAVPPEQAAVELPSGSSAAFRARMMDWSPSVDVRDGEPGEVVVRRRGSGPGEPPRLPRLSSRFGLRGDPMHGRARMHSGIDIPGPLGTPVQASERGLVRFAGSAGGYGRMVEIAHGDGLSTRYAHLSRILVQPGAVVARGETIALMGSTGRSTGSHLHFEVRSNGRPANPLAYFGASPAADEIVYTLRRAPAEAHLSRYAQARAAASGSIAGVF